MTNVTTLNTDTKAASEHVPGVFELAREDLTVLREGFASGDPLWVVSAWKHLLDGIPEDVNFEGESADELAHDVMRDIGEEAAFSGWADRTRELDRYVACIKLASAYRQEEWPRLVLCDYLRVFEAIEPEQADVLSRRAWDYAQILYNGVKARNSTMEKKAA